MKRIALLIVALVTAVSTSIAQQAGAPPSQKSVTRGDFKVKTVPLHHLTSMEAVKLLSPYVQTNGGGVYEVSPNIRAVTIREIPTVYAEMMDVLKQYDRDPATVSLNFQLIAAENTNKREPGLAGLDSLLRGVLKYSGYRLLTTSVATASEDGVVTQTLAAEGDTYALEVGVHDLRIDGNDASVRINVRLVRNGVPSRGQPTSIVLSTGVTVPIGQTVVLGTSAIDARRSGASGSGEPLLIVDGVPVNNGQGASASDGQRALILTVRPQLVPVKR
jgi:hypothetical protein